jgi:hypothetical protein
MKKNIYNIESKIWPNWNKRWTLRLSFYTRLDCLTLMINFVNDLKLTTSSSRVGS